MLFLYCFFAECIEASKRHLKVRAWAMAYALRRGAFRLRQVAAAPAEVREARLEVQRDRVVDLGRDAQAQEVGSQFVAPYRAHDVLVEDVS